MLLGNDIGTGDRHLLTILDQSPEPKELVTFPREAHGIEIFFASYKDEFKQLLLDFLEHIR